MTLELFFASILTPLVGLVILAELYRVCYINKKELEAKIRTLEIRVKILEKKVYNAKE